MREHTGSHSLQYGTPSCPKMIEIITLWRERKREREREIEREREREKERERERD